MRTASSPRVLQTYIGIHAEGKKFFLLVEACSTESSFKWALGIYCSDASLRNTKDLIYGDWRLLERKAELRKSAQPVNLNGLHEEHMIPSDFIAVHRLVAARFHECLMELFSTDEADKWLLQLRHERAGNLGFLLTVDNLAAFCVAMQQCIDVAISHSDYPNAEMMINTVALNLETNKPTRGGISISSIWADDPNVQFNFYLDQNDSRSCVTLIYFLEDAMRLHDRFAIAYNKRECF